MARIAGLVRPGGTLLTAALRRSRGYLVGGKTFPSPNVDENDMRAVLEPCFGAARIDRGLRTGRARIAWLREHRAGLGRRRAPAAR